ncbi:MAG: hypothetical protein MR894_06245 [Akkermansia muciniphila]|nr:hypothetical protein [Akkermansia muciniphila]
MARLRPKPCGNTAVRIGKYVFYHRGDGKPLEFSRDEEWLMFYDRYVPECSQCKTCVHVSEHAMQDWLQDKSYSEEKAREMAHLFQATKMYCPRWREEMGEMRPRNVCDHGLPCPFYEPQENAEADK